MLINYINLADCGNSHVHCVIHCQTVRRFGRYYCKVWQDLIAIFYHCCHAVFSFDRVLLLPVTDWRQENIVGVEARLRTGRSGVRVPVGLRNFYFFQNVQTDSGAQLALLFSGYRCSSLGLKCPGREFGRSPPHLTPS